MAEAVEKPEAKFTWGDSVILIKNGAAVCGVSYSEEKKEYFYTVEFGNGDSIEAPESWLKKDDE